MIEIANTIALIDIPPEELLKRLAEGKVYVPAQAELAAESFFRKGNLIALRELALRTLAKRVNEQALLYKQGQGIKQIWPIVEKILICVGPGQESLKLIRAGKRLAMSLQAEWIAVYVDAATIRASEIERNQAIQNLRFAEQLGAETRILTGNDIVKEIIQFATLQNVTLIMLWKDIRTRWKDFIFRGLADEILRFSGEIDVYTMTGERRKKTRQFFKIKPAIPWVPYALSICIVGLTTLVSLLIYPFLSDKNPVMIYLLGMMSISLFGRMGPSILGNLLSVFIYEFFFISPYYTLATNNFSDFFSLAIMFAIAQLISHLIITTSLQIQAARLTEEHTASLYKLSRKLSRTRGSIKLLKVGIDYIAEIFESDVIALLPKNKGLVIRARALTNQELDEKERGIAHWVYEMGQKAGLGTNTLSFSNALYIPLLGARHATLGVLRIHPNHSEQLVSPEKILLIESCAYQIALALEVDRFQETTNQEKAPPNDKEGN
jgi:two-component system sensor histidine kinase KdpD